MGVREVEFQGCPWGVSEAICMRRGSVRVGWWSAVRRGRRMDGVARRGIACTANQVDVATKKYTEDDCSF